MNNKLNYFYFADSRQLSQCNASGTRDNSWCYFKPCDSTQPLLPQ